MSPTDPTGFFVSVQSDDNLIGLGEHLIPYLQKLGANVDEIWSGAAPVPMRGGAGFVEEALIVILCLLGVFRMRTRHILLACFAAFAFSLNSLVTAHASVYGSFARITANDCSPAPPDRGCFSAPPAIRVLSQDIGGLASSAGLSESRVLPGVGGYNLIADFSGEASLPLIRTSVTSEAAGRVFVSTAIQQGYRYAGEESTQLPLVADLDFELLEESDPTTGVRNFLTVTFSLLESPFLDTVSAPFCGSPGTLAHGVFQTNSAGPGAAMIDLTTGCDGDPVMLAPEDEFFVYLAVSASGDRSGGVEALNSFEARFSDALQGADRAALIDSLFPASEIPAPAALTLLLTALAGAFGFEKRSRMRKSAPLQGSD